MWRIETRFEMLGNFDIGPHISEIERLAWENTPDWDNWCGNACQRISEYLSAQGIGHRIVDNEEVPTFPWGTHTWIELDNGTIIDPTMTQFWGESHPRTKGSPSTDRTGVFPSSHPANKYYK